MGTMTKREAERARARCLLLADWCDEMIEAAESANSWREPVRLPFATWGHLRSFAEHWSFRWAREANRYATIARSLS